MEYYYNRDYLQEKFDKNENILVVFCEIGQKIFTQEIIFNENMSIDFKCSCKIPYCDHLEMLVNYIKNNYLNIDKNHFFKINYINLNKFLSIPISGSKGDHYCIDIKYDYNKNFTYHCSCGLKYTKYNRHKCKHIDNTLNSILNVFNNKKDEYEENNSISNEFKNLNIEI